MSGADGQKPYLFLLACLISILLPALLLFDLRSVFVCDWANDVWLTNYAAEYFAHHLKFPSVIHTTDITGMAYPIFYGYLLFPLLAMFSGGLDGSIGLRLVSLLVWALQFTLFYKLIEKQSQNRLLSFTIASLIIWAIYPMTNLYNRGAMPEFIATGSLFSAIALWFMTVLADSSRSRLLCGNASVLLMVVAAGAHPITAVYGGVFYLSVVVMTVWIKGAKQAGPAIRAMLVPAVVGIICIAPWVMSTKTFLRLITVSRFDEVMYYPATLDSAWARLTPFPIPSAYYDEYLEKEHVGTKNLDTQISIPLMLLFCALVFGLARKKELAANKLTLALLILAGVTVTLIVLSLYRGSLDHLGYLARSIQFAYRLVTYINLTIIAAVIVAIVFRHDERNAVKCSPVVLYALLAMAVIGVGLKWQRGIATTKYEPEAIVARPAQNVLVSLPPSFYGSDAYTTFTNLPMLDEVKENAVRVLFQPETGSRFGELSKAVVPAERWLWTSVHSFAWNKVAIDDVPVTDTDRLAHVHMHLAVKAPGHSAAYQFCPDKTWQILNSIAIPVFLLWMALSILAALPIVRKA